MRSWDCASSLKNPADGPKSLAQGDDAGGSGVGGRWRAEGGGGSDASLPSQQPNGHQCLM
jgi:hypothetical protein